MKEIQRVPAPWNLRGNGFILLYTFSKKEMEHDRFLTPKFRENFRGGLAALMIVDYKDSDVGPYSELLFIPGKFKYGKSIKNTISRIYVSTMESVVNGVENWAIPKNKARFAMTRDADGCTEVTVQENDVTFFSIRLKSGRVPFPVHTALMPFPLVQEKDGKAYYTKFTGRGLGHLAKVLDIQVDENRFPDVSGKKPLLAIEVNPFEICFPVAEIRG